MGWYLNYLLLWYVIFWLIHKVPVLAENKNNRFFTFAVVSVVLLVYFSFTSSIRFEQSFSFLIGIWLANYDEELCSTGVKIGKRRITKDKLIRLSNGIAALFIALVILAVKQISFVREQSDTVLNVINLGIKMSSSVGILICVLVFEETRGVFRKSWNSIKRILTPVGKASFELYLVHGYALAVFSAGWNKRLCVLAFLAITIVGTIVFHLFNTWLGKMLRGKFIVSNYVSEGGAI